MCGKSAFVLAVITIFALGLTYALNDKKPNYRLDFEGLTIHREVSDEFYIFHSGRIGLTPRSVNSRMVLNSNYTLKKDLPDNSWVSVTAYEQKANQDYSLIPIVMFSGTWCELVKTDQFAYKDVVKYTNFGDICPPRKGCYYIQDYKVNEDLMPPELPGDRWKVEVQIKSSHHGKLIFWWTIYFNTNRNI